MSRMSANLLLLLAAIVWGAAFVAQSKAMDVIGPLSFTGLRMLLGALCVAPFAWWEYKRSTTKPANKTVLIGGTGLGVVFFLGMILQQSGFLTTTVTNAGFLTALYVVFTPVLGFLIFRKLPNPVIWPIIALSLTGTYLLAGGLSGLVEGDILVMISAFFWGLQVLLVGYIVGKHGHPITFAFLQFLVSGLIGLALGLSFEPLTIAQIQASWMEIAYTGILSSALAFTLQAVAQRYTPAPDAAILLSTESLFAALFGVMLLGESLSPTKWLGCALIFSCILLVELLPLITKRIKAMRAQQAA